VFVVVRRGGPERRCDKVDVKFLVRRSRSAACFAEPGPRSCRRRHSVGPPQRTALARDDGGRRGTGLAPMLAVGGICGLAWAAGLRGFMAEIAGSASGVEWAGTFGWILLPGVLRCSGSGAPSHTDRLPCRRMMPGRSSRLERQPGRPGRTRPTEHPLPPWIRVARPSRQGTVRGRLEGAVPATRPSSSHQIRPSRHR
jgi:hypothetical protein